MDEIREQGQAQRKTWSTYEDYVKDTDAYARNTAEAAVRFGYALKYARDTGILRESGYQTMRDFARDRYGLTESAASRLIGICEKYSVGGDSMELEASYGRFSISQLSEMLNFPDALIEAIPEDMSREELRDIRKEVREEEKVTDIERMIDAADAAGADPEEPEDIMEVIMTEYLKGTMLIKPAKMAQTGEELAAVLTASGHFYAKGRGKDRIKRVITGTGASDPVYISNLRTGEKEERTWDDVLISTRKAIKKLEAEPENGGGATPSPTASIAASPEIQEQNSYETLENAAPTASTAASPEIQEQNSAESENKAEDEEKNNPENIKPRDFRYMNAPETDENDRKTVEKEQGPEAPKGEGATPSPTASTAGLPEKQEQNSHETLENASPTASIAGSGGFEGAKNEEIAQAQDDELPEEPEEIKNLRQQVEEKADLVREHIRSGELKEAQSEAFDLYQDISRLRMKIAREKFDKGTEGDEDEERAKGTV